ncbi:MAG: cation transporting ATPase C-terminal domain-containing protein [Gallintestinimicrobium sp.]
MFAAVLMGLPSPLQSAHILWINLITDSLPALALGVDKNDGKELMGRPPRTASESLLANGGLSVICFYGALIAGISLTAFFTVPYMLMKQERADFRLRCWLRFWNRKRC